MPLGEKLPDKVRRLETESELVREDLADIRAQMKQFVEALEKLQGDRQLLVASGKFVWTIAKRLLGMALVAALGWATARWGALLHVVGWEHEK